MHGLFSLDILQLEYNYILFIPTLWYCHLHQMVIEIFQGRFAVGSKWTFTYSVQDHILLVNSLRFHQSGVIGFRTEGSYWTEICIWRMTYSNGCV